MKSNRKSKDRGAAEETAAPDDAVIGKALFWSLLVMASVGVVAAAGYGVYWLRTLRTAPSVVVDELKAPQTRSLPAASLPEVKFADITDASGLRFTHFSGAEGEKLLPETMGSGCAFFDYDNDGDQDVLLVNSAAWPWAKRKEKTPSTSALFRNDGKGNFEDVTTDSGLDVTIYGMGVACGDYDADGWTDVFISAVGLNRLFHNERGKFVEVTEAAGVGGVPTQWSTGCGFFDYDNDGDLDLMVVNYVAWSRDFDVAQGFRLVDDIRAYGPPRAFPGTFPYLYRNDGDGKFTDISKDAGIDVKNSSTGVPVAKSMAIAPVDLDSDGWMDVIVSNDTVQNFVYHNQRNGKFKEIGTQSGLAFGSDGLPRGAMGTDVAHFRNDKTLAVVIANYATEPTALYMSQENPLQFVDNATATGLGPQSRLELKFGIFFFDSDLDGRLDILSANGHLEDEISKLQASQTYAQPPKLYWNCGLDQSSEIVPLSAEKLGKDFVQPMVGRGASYADIDGDGDLDVLLTASRGPARLLRNDQKLGHHWLRLKLVGSGSNPEAIGAWVEVHVGDQVMQRQVMPTRSYLSQTELPVTFGLGKADKPDKVIIRWPNGKRQEVARPEIDKLQTIRQEDSEK